VSFRRNVSDFQTTFVFQISFGENQLTISTASWIKTCQLKQPEFTKCSTESIRGLFANTFNGNFKIKNFDSLDPMHLDKLNVLQGSGPVAVNASLSNVKIVGMSSMFLVENQVSAKDYSWLTTMKIPKLRLDADYRMRGQILIIPINVSVKSNKSNQLQVVSFQL
jgi:hypothetical protein